MSGSNSKTKLVAGTETSLRWDLSVNHQGDCAVYVGYGRALSAGKGDNKRAAQFVKIANVFDCQQYNGKEYPVDLPSWLPAGPAVIRWEWYALHVWPMMEFYTQCADVIIESESKLAVADLPSYPIVSPQMFPSKGDGRAPGFRCTWCNTEQFQTGPPCAFPDKATKRAQCGNTAPGTTGHVYPFALDGATPAPTVEGATPAPVVAVATPAPVVATPSPVEGPDGPCENTPWNACGGKSFPNALSCCPAGTVCYKHTEWYSQCRTKGDCPKDWACQGGGGDDETPTKKPTAEPTVAPKPTAKPTRRPDNEDCPAEKDSVLNVIGYYGNSGGPGCQNCIPAIPDIPAEYNVLVLTFINFAADGSIDFLVNGPHAKEDLPNIVKAWKQQADPWGRPRHALVSLGGQNGNWPSGVDADLGESILAKLVEFLEHYNLDGLDVDLEGGALVGAATVAQVVEELRAQCYYVGAAPEAAQGPLNAYADLLHDLSWVHPQFYNNGPNAVTAPWTGNGSNSPRNIGWNPTKTWQETCSNCPDEPFWYTILENIGFEGELEHEQLGMLVPATTLAAGNNNVWDYGKLAANVEKLGLKHVGTWAIGHDSTKDYQFARSFTAVLDRRFAALEPTPKPTEEPEPTPKPTEEPILAFESFDIFKAWCATSADEKACKRCLGRFKSKRGVSSCQPPKKAKKLKCKKVKDNQLCEAVGCSLKKRSGKCQGRAFSK